MPFLLYTIAHFQYLQAFNILQEIAVIIAKVLRNTDGALALKLQYTNATNRISRIIQYMYCEKDKWPDSSQNTSTRIRMNAPVRHAMQV